MIRWLGFFLQAVWECRIVKILPLFQKPVFVLDSVQMPKHS